MAKVKGAGIRSNILLDDVDIKILSLIDKSKTELSIGDVQKKVKMSHVSFKIHVRRLEKLKFITRHRLDKKFKFILKPTKEGKSVLRIFEKVV